MFPSILVGFIMLYIIKCFILDQMHKMVNCCFFVVNLYWNVSLLILQWQWTGLISLNLDFNVIVHQESQGVYYVHHRCFLWLIVAKTEEHCVVEGIMRRHSGVLNTIKHYRLTENKQWVFTKEVKWVIVQNHIITYLHIHLMAIFE